MKWINVQSESYVWGRVVRADFILWEQTVDTDSLWREETKFSLCQWDSVQVQHSLHRYCTVLYRCSGHRCAVPWLSGTGSHHSGSGWRSEQLTGRGSLRYHWGCWMSLSERHSQTAGGQTDREDYRSAPLTMILITDDDIYDVIDHWFWSLFGPFRLVGRCRAGRRTQAASVYILQVEGRSSADAPTPPRGNESYSHPVCVSK